MVITLFRCDWKTLEDWKAMEGVCVCVCVWRGAEGGETREWVGKDPVTGFLM